MDYGNDTTTPVPAALPAPTLNASQIIELCSKPEDFLLTERIWLCVVCGATVAIMSIIFNIFIFAFFMANKQHRKTPNLYLLLLSLFDVFVSFSYIAVMSVRVVINLTASYYLKSIWVGYMVPLLAVSHIGITSSTFLICCASIERYCISVNNLLVPKLQKHRPVLAFLAIMSAVITKGTLLKEVTVIEDPDCIGMLNQWGVAPHPIINEYPNFSVFWRFYFRNIFTILAPFFVLLLVNILIFYRLRKLGRQGKDTDKKLIDKQHVKEKKARIMAATRSLVIVVCTYLFSNLLSVIVTIWEYLDSTPLFTTYVVFYVLSVDVISLLTIVASVLRLPIYVICQPALRKEMFEFFGQLWQRDKLSKQRTLLEGIRIPTASLINTLEGDSDCFSRIEFV